MSEGSAGMKPIEIRHLWRERKLDNGLIVDEQVLQYRYWPPNMTYNDGEYSSEPEWVDVPSVVEEI